MNQRQIESFLAVAETGNFTRAAERLYISQPAVSKQVLSLEEELGFLLLIREYHKDVQLTEAGKLYYDFFHKVMGEYKAVYEQAQQYRKKVRGTVRLGILTGWKIQDKLQNILEQMKQNYPEIEVRMSFADLEPLRKAAESGKLDLIFTIRDSVKNVEFERRSQSDCVHEQVAKADCECPLYGELTECREGTLEWVDKEEVLSLPTWEGDHLFLERLLSDDPQFFSLKVVYEGDHLAKWTFY